VAFEIKAPILPADTRSMWLERIVGYTHVPVAPLRPDEVRIYGYLRVVFLPAITLVMVAIAASQGSAVASVVIAVVIWVPCVFFGWRSVVRVSDAGLTAAALNRGQTFTPWSDIRAFTIAPAWGGTSERVDIVRVDGGTVPLDALGSWNFWRLRTEMYRDALEAERRFAAQDTAG
jgi:hypothetical protein